MPDLLLSAVEYSGYISLIKFIAFLILFFLWLPLVGWVYRDAQAVETKEIFWTTIVFGTGAIGAIIWLVVPVFVVGILLYLIAVATATICYVSHRNTRVLDFDRVLTAEHIKGLFAKKQKVQPDFLGNG